jgi:RimJ/RimL family protein N-acetyltransferase
LLESYPETDHLLKTPGAFSIDYLIGDDEYVGHGYGARMISVFIYRVGMHLYPEATGVATSAEVGNLPSLGALRRAGFAAGEIVQGEHGPEQVMRLRFA